MRRLIISLTSTVMVLLQILRGLRIREHLKEYGAGPTIYDEVEFLQSITGEGFKRSVGTQKFTPKGVEATVKKPFEKVVDKHTYQQKQGSGPTIAMNE